jgi:hypothetical protein
MSLAQYASPYNNDETGEINNINANIRMTQSQNQNQQYRGGGGIKGEKKMPPSSFRKTIKRPLAQQQQKQEHSNLESSSQSQSQSRVADFMSKLNSVKGANYLQGNGGGDDGTNGSDSADLADYQPMNSSFSNDQVGIMDSNSNSNEHQNENGDNDDGVVTRENFENLPSTYASQYYQQYVPYSRQPQSNVDSNGTGSKDDLMQKMNHIIQMLEDQQDEKTGSVTEELILYCFLGVFVIFVVDSFVRAGKYVR